MTSVFDSPQFNANLFFPRPDRLAPPEGSDEIYIEVELEEGEELEEIIIEATRSSRTIDDIPTRIETITGEELGEKAGIQRYKGLGEMNAVQLWETTLDREKRALKQVRIEDAVMSDEVFSTLMGDDVAPRRKFIMDHAKEVTELDV